MLVGKIELQHANSTAFQRRVRLVTFWAIWKIELISKHCDINIKNDHQECETIKLIVLLSKVDRLAEQVLLLV